MGHENITQRTTRKTEEKPNWNNEGKENCSKSNKRLSGTSHQQKESRGGQAIRAWRQDEDIGTLSQEQ